MEQVDTGKRETPLIGGADESSLVERWRATLLVSPNPGPRQRPPRHVFALVLALSCAVATSIAFGVEALSPVEMRGFPHASGWFISLIGYTGTWVTLGWTVLLFALGRRWLALGSGIAVATASALCVWGVGGLLVPGQGERFVPVVAAVFAFGFASGGELALTTERRWWWTVVVGSLAMGIRNHAAFWAFADTAAIGTVIGSSVSLALGSRPRGADPATVKTVLTSLGIDVDTVHPEDHSGEWGLSELRARNDQGEYLVEVFGRDAREGLLLTRLWRSIWYKDADSPLTISRSSQVERQVAAITMAKRTGISVPTVVAAARVSASGDAFLILDEPSGRRFGELTAAERVRAAPAVWEALEELRANRVAHRSLGPSTILVHEDGSIIFVGFARSQLMADEQMLNTDRAALLFSTASIDSVGDATRAAHEVIGTEGLASAVQLLQPATLGSSSPLVRTDKALLAALRNEAKVSCGVDSADPIPIKRVSFGTVAMAAGAFLGFWLLAVQLAGFDDLASTLSGAAWGWVVVVFLLNFANDASDALALSGAQAELLPVGPLLLLRLANAFIGLVSGTVGKTTAIVRFYQRRGIPITIAVSSGLFYSFSGFLVQVALSCIGLLLAADEFHSLNVSGDENGTLATILVIIVIVAVLASLFFIVLPRLRRAVMAKARPQAEIAWTNLRAVAAHPGQLARLFGGGALGQLLMALGLEAALYAYGSSASLAAIVVVNSAVCLVGGMAPVPGGMGVMEAGYIAGLQSIGVPQDNAIAATLIFRLATTYLPPVWGYFALIVLRRRDEL